MEMANFSDNYFIQHFKTYTKAARYFGTSPQAITNIKNGTQPPNKAMLLSMGYVKESVYKRVK